jgi:hypothetical protein
VSERNRDPQPHPLVLRLSQEDVIELVGLVGERGEDGTMRVFADEDLQRWMDVPDAALVDTEPVPDDPRGRTRVWVRRDAWAADAFTDGAEDCLDEAIDGPGMSTWQFLPQSRIVAAEMMGLLARTELWRYEEEETAS